MAVPHVPCFTLLNTTEQAEQLVNYLKELDPSLTFVDNSIREIVQGCQAIFGTGREQDAESVLNSVVTLIFAPEIGAEDFGDVAKAFCQCLVRAPTDNFASICLRVMKNLYDGLSENIDLQYEAYLTLVKLASRTNQLSDVYKDLATVKSRYNVRSIGVERTQQLYRVLHTSLLAAGKGDLASQVMIELLGTYTEENASHAKQDAVTCIASFLKDPNTFLMDHLLTLKPVKFLEGEPIHDLLTIFVSEKLQEYVAFYQKHKSFVDSLGLSHEQNMHKMRLLSFMQMAECRKEIAYDTVREELQLEQDAVEPFVIDVLRTRLVRAKVDQLNKKVLVQSTMHRTFGRPQWQQLRDVLSEWKNNFSHVEQTIKAAVKGQETMAS